MRRPTPLPPTAPPAAAQRPARGRPADDTVSRDDDGLLAPVIPLGAASDESDGDGARAEAYAGGSAAEGTDAAPIGIRDVWKAAHARRRALRAEVRRFTARQRRRRMVWIGVAASLLLLILTTLAAAYSPLFAVEKVHVVGTSLLDAASVEEALQNQVGTPLPLVDESEVKAALIAFPLVQSYSLEARPPHELVVRIVERLPVGLIETAAGYTLVDAAGVALSTTEEPAAGRPLLTIAGGTGSKAFEAVGQVMRALPETIRSQVTAISASTPDDVALTLGATDTQVIWGSADDSAMKALVLQKVMQSRPPESVSTYDVSSPNAVVVR